MKKAKIIFWITTTIIFLFEGVLVAFTSQTEFAKEGIRHLGYPDYFGSMFAVFKVLGTLSLIIPKVPSRIKEWAYAGFGIDFISAFVSIMIVDGFGFGAILPLIFLGLLVLSYINYHKMHSLSKML
ncbi:MAG TPA: DoxX family protein [Candidatus Paceibacterota bacterium]|nr:DoxX family protein [Candidatus Paceibacterota bacterium]